MATASVRRYVHPSTLYLWGAVLLAELLLLVGYFGATGAEVTRLRYVIYPFVWINVGLWAVMQVRPGEASPRRRWAAIALAGGYFVALAVVTGLIGLPHMGHAHAHLQGWVVTMSAPGWGPRIGYAFAEGGHLYFVPYRVIGYLSLAYLVYATLVDVSGAVLSGVLGFGACVSCSFPLLAPLVAGMFGASATTVSAVFGHSLDLSTAIFVLAVALLVWRPGFRVRS